MPIRSSAAEPTAMTTGACSLTNGADRLQVAVSAAPTTTTGRPAIGVARSGRPRPLSRLVLGA